MSDEASWKIPEGTPGAEGTFEVIFNKPILNFHAELPEGILDSTHGVIPERIPSSISESIPEEIS